MIICRPSSSARQATLLAWLRLARVYQRVDRATAARLRAADLSVAHFDVLVHLGVAEGLTQQELADLEVTGQAGAGMVEVVLNGKHEARRVRIDPKLLADDKDMLEDLVTAAINDAVHKLEQVTREKFSGLGAGFNLPMGMKLPF